MLLPLWKMFGIMKGTEKNEWKINVNDELESLYIRNQTP